MRIYVGGISFNSDNERLRNLFATMGTVTEATIMQDRDSGQSKGFGFVEMPEASEANAAIAKFNGHDFDGRALTVNEAKPRENRPTSGGGGGHAGNRSSGPRW